MPLEDHAERVLDLVATIPEGRVLAYGDIAKRLGGMGPRTVGTVMSRYGSDLPWWRVIRSDGRPPQGLEDEALEHWRAEGTPMVGGLVEGGRADMASARWDFGGAPAASGAGRERGPARRPAPRRDLGRRHRRGHARVGLAARRLGYHLGDDWGHGQAWELGSLYVVVEAGPDVVAGRHERTRAGLNHLAFHGGSRAEVDALVDACGEGGWTLMFADTHPYAGGPQHYAAYLESGEGFEVEVVAADT